MGCSNNISNNSFYYCFTQKEKSYIEKLRRLYSEKLGEALQIKYLEENIPKDEDKESKDEKEFKVEGGNYYMIYDRVEIDVANKTKKWRIYCQRIYSSIFVG